MNFITAKQVHDGRQFLNENTVLAIGENGTVRDILTTHDVDPLKLRHYEGILCPGFVNAHCHLELSHFKGLIPQKTGIVDFALHIIKNRSASPIEEIREKAAETDRQMWHNGIVAVGDICNTNHTIQTKSDSKIHYHSFIELLALNPARAEQVFEGGMALQNEYLHANLSASLAPHAPYTVSFELMEMIARQQAISSIHSQESTQENLFFENKTGNFLKLYSSLNLPIDYFKPTGKTSLQSFLPHLSTEKALLLVHNTVSSKEDIAFAESLSKQLYWCLCPNANIYIEGAMPPVDLLDTAGSRVCLGTDSLASNHRLSIASEMQSITAHFPGIALEKLIMWATYNGAAFLGLTERFGTLEKNKAPGINLVTQKQGRLEAEKLF